MHPLPTGDTSRESGHNTPAQIRCTLLDIHADACDSVRRIAEALSLTPYISAPQSPSASERIAFTYRLSHTPHFECRRAQEPSA